MENWSVVNKDYVSIFSGFKGEEGDLIPVLQRIQQKFGYISEKSIKHVSLFLKISENQIFGVASFYSQFRFTEPGRNSIKVCMGTACHVRGGQILCEALERELDISTGQTTKDKRFDLQRVACLGCCALAPVIQINDDIHSQMTVIRLKQVLEKYD
jgi:NADH:ubiquinone oxidoreductase subunit E